MLYLITKTVDPNTLEDLRFDSGIVRETTAGVTNGVDKNGGYHPQIRSTTLKLVKSVDFPDISNSILKALGQFDPTVHIDDYSAQEFNYLLYKVGDHFKKHKDVIKVANPRIYTTVTLVRKSDDLVGGDLRVWDKKGVMQVINLKVGETVIFNSSTFHQVTPVEQGTRESLVVWINKKIDPSI